MIRQVRLLVLAIFFLSTASAAVATDIDSRGSGNHYEIWTKRVSQTPLTSPARPANATRIEGRQAGGQVPRVRYEYRSPCDTGVGNPNTGAGVCPASPCPPGSVQYRQWQVAAGGETPLGFVCSSNGAPPAVAAAAPAPPQVTDAMVLAAFRRVPVPELRSQSQPGDKTLVNFDTIFYTEAEPLTRTVTILGQSVRLEIEPSSFTWQHGDGTSATTSTAGAPYPAKDVVHRYADAHVTVQHRVVVTWSAQWSLNGGPLQPVAGTVTTTGPTTPLRVAEASPSLSGQR